MNIEKNKKSTKRTSIILASVVAALLLGGAGVYALTNTSLFEKSNSETNQGTEQPPENKIDYEGSTDEQKDAGVEAKEEFINKHENQDPEQQTVAVSITSLQQNQTTLNVRTVIQTQVAQGSCTLILEKQGQSSFSQSTDLQSMGSYVTCKGFDVQLNDFEKGDWKLTINYKDGQRTGSDSRTVTIK